MLQVNKDTDDEVALESCEFWWSSTLWSIELDMNVLASSMVAICVAIRSHAREIGNRC
jgi:hypothetical protein